MTDQEEGGPGTGKPSIDPPAIEGSAVLDVPDTKPPGVVPHEKPHVRWRFAVLSAALAISLFGAFSPWTPAEARSGGFAIAGSIITAFAKPLEGMGP